MADKIEYLVKKTLEEKGFSLNYNPKSSRYTPWYKIPFKINFREGKWMGRGNIVSRRFTIPTKGYYKSIDRLAGCLLHEAGHIDIFPVELPLLLYTMNKVYNQFDGPAKGIIITLGVAAVYFLSVRELIVEGYNSLKHGAKKYLKLRWIRE